MEAAVKTFFSSPRFAVVGASSDPAKFGHKVFVWYLQHGMPVTPINPSAPQVSIPSTRSTRRSTYSTANTPYKTLQSAAALGAAAPQTALSIITPPSVTKQILEQAKEAGVRAVWLQPGSFDQAGLEYARREWPDAAVAGTDVPGSRGGEGWCVLVDGEWGIELARRKPSRL